MVSCRVAASAERTLKFKAVVPAPSSSQLTLSVRPSVSRTVTGAGVVLASAE
jgi:hypothetical protein